MKEISIEIIEKAQCFTTDTVTSVSRITDGAINETYEVHAESGRFILQKMSRLFSPVVMDNLSAVQQYVVAAGVLIPEGIRTVEGNEYVLNGGVHWYRALKYVPGKTVHHNLSVNSAESAGALVGLFHSALVDFTDELQVSLPHYHDNEFYLEELHKAVESSQDKNKQEILQPLAEEAIRRFKEYFVDGTTMPKRVVHADLKTSNIRFTDEGEAVALIDMDTMMNDSIMVEMGDALRSWAGVAGEDDPKQVFDIEIARAALESYKEAAVGITTAETDSIVDGIGLMTASLAIRFITDAYNESYFALNSQYKNLYEQNLMRGRNQLALLDDFESKKDQL